MIEDIDLDVSSLLEKVPEDHVSFYFRASADDSKDFAYVKGDLEDMSDALANIMEQSEQIANMVAAATSKILGMKLFLIGLFLGMFIGYAICDLLTKESSIIYHIKKLRAKKGAEIHVEAEAVMEEKDRKTRRKERRKNK